ncbi:MAG: DUF2171 domain-containing protein [Pseudomonadota bacterium]|nr:DUF2171 domain-containing protein [Pseudomonadota bacterium]
MADVHLIRQGMEVLSADGELVGRVVGTADGITVHPTGTAAPGAHPLPDHWVVRVDEHVHLRHSAAVVRGEWSGYAAPEPHPTEGGARLPWIIGLVLLAIAVLLLVWGFVYAADSRTDPGEPLPSTGQSFNAG